MKSKITLLLLAFSFCSFAQTIALPQFSTGFTDVTEITNAGDARLFVVQQAGTIRIVNPDGTIKPNNFLTLPSSLVLSGGERGLLGLVFHPQYATNGYFFVDYTRNTDGATVIARYSVNPTNPDLADASTGVVLLTIPQPFANHNGGTLRFGPDGYLYIGMGDGGSGGDPGNRAQNINEYLGKILRIDVDTTTGSLPYGIPPTNPYVGIDGNDEIWAIGVRNPWKYSFDRNNNDLWIADVGQSAVEEINHIAAPAAPGLNFGWKCYEGNSVYTTGCAVPTTTYTFPVASYTHVGGACSITGGYVYTGSTYPNMQNKYFFADYCVNRIGMVDVNTNAISYSATFSGSNYFTTFGQDMNGELYIAASATGKIHRVVDTTLGVNAFGTSGFSITPNPTSSEFFVKMDQAKFPAQVKVIDVTGKVLLNQRLDAATNPISVSTLQNGIYVISIIDNSGAVSSSKLAVNN